MFVINSIQTLLHTCTQLVNHDLYIHLASLVKEAKRGISSHSTKCKICTQKFNAQQQKEASEADPVICFRWVLPGRRWKGCESRLAKGRIKECPSVDMLEGMNTSRTGPTEGACWMAVPAMSPRPRTSALRIPSTHPVIRNANYR